MLLTRGQTHKVQHYQNDQSAWLHLMLRLDIILDSL